MGVVSTVPHLSCGEKDFVRSGHSYRASLTEAHLFFSFLLVVPALQHVFKLVHFFLSRVQTLFLLGIFFLKHYLFSLFHRAVYVACTMDDGSVAGTVRKCTMLSFANWFCGEGLFPRIMCICLAWESLGALRLICVIGIFLRNRACIISVALSHCSLSSRRMMVVTYTALSCRSPSPCLHGRASAKIGDSSYQKPWKRKRRDHTFFSHCPRVLVPAIQGQLNLVLRRPSAAHAARRNWNVPVSKLSTAVWLWCVSHSLLPELQHLESGVDLFDWPELWDSRMGPWEQGAWIAEVCIGALPLCL